MENELTRRSFLAGSAALGAGIAAGAAGMQTSAWADEAEAETEEAEDAEEESSLPSFLAQPDPITDIAQTLETEVVVVGLGLAGVAATRSAAEEGLQVIAIERCASPCYRSQQFACFNSENARAMGIDDLDTTELVNELMVQTGHRADFRVLKNWADNCGEAFDWYANGYDGLLWQYPDGDETYDATTQVFVINKNDYKAYEYGVDHEKVFSGTLTFRSPDAIGAHGPVMLANLEKAEETGNVQTIYNARGRQLVKDGDRVAGVIYQDVTTGEYTQINASKGVILAAGGYVRNDEMLAYYIPWVYNLKDSFTFTYPHTDANVEYTDQGDGMLMGYWAGGHIEEGPHCAMCHGDLGTMGVAAFLQLNALGERYINEDLTNDHFGSAILRQPEHLVYQIFDANFPEQITHMQASLGSYTSLSDSKIETVDDWTSAKGDTLEELAANLELDEDVAATFVAQIERYNELCDLGVDEDFGKTSERMLKLDTPPYYAIRYQVGGELVGSASQNALRCLVTMSGLSTNSRAQVLDDDLYPIEGLYAVGNTQGGRFLGDYPATIAGASHSIALTYGYLAGKYIAE